MERPQRGRSGFSLVGIAIQKNNRYAVKGLGHEMDCNFVDMTCMDRPWPQKSWHRILNFSRCYASEKKYAYSLR